MPDHPVQVVSLLLVGVGVIGMVWRLEKSRSEREQQIAEDFGRAMKDPRRDAVQRRLSGSQVVKLAKAFGRLGEWQRAKRRG